MPTCVTLGRSVDLLGLSVRTAEFRAGARIAQAPLEPCSGQLCLQCAPCHGDAQCGLSL